MEIEVINDIDSSALEEGGIGDIEIFINAKDNTQVG